MNDEDRDRPLPRRSRGEAWAGPVPSGESRPRAQAASASGMAAQEQDRSAAGEVTSPPVENGPEGGTASGAAWTKGPAVTAEPPRPAQPARAAQPGRPAQPGRTANAGPPAEDEVTEWLGAAVSTRHAVDHAPADTPGSGVNGTAGDKPGHWSWAWLAVLVAAALVGSLAVAVVRHFVARPGNGAAGDAAVRLQAAARDAAAAWIAQQVSRDVMVSCDPVMCAALTAHGFPARDLLVLGPASPSPVHTAVVVETATVRDLFGTSLALAWAPAVLASFGSGASATTVRVMAPHGTAAYQTALADSQAADQAAGDALLRDPRAAVRTSAGRQLAGGLVDSRLVAALQALAGHLPITIMQFGNTGPGASSGVPLRFADLAESDRAARMPGAAYLQAVLAYLGGLKAGYRPARTTIVVLPGGQPVLRVEFTAPSPLAVAGSQGSS